MSRRRLIPALAVTAALVLGGAAKPEGPEPTWRERQIQRLISWENARRLSVDFLEQAPANRTLGPNPVHVVRLTGDNLATCLSGSDRVVIHGPAGTILQTLPSPSGTCALAAAGDTLYAVGNLSGAVAQYTRRKNGWTETLRVPLPGAVSLTGIALQGDSLVVVDRALRRMTTLSRTLDIGSTRTLPYRPHRVWARGGWRVVLSVLDHTVQAWPPGTGEPTTIEHLGPVWSAALLPRGEELWLAVGGVEDRNLDRSRGFFGSIDSIVYLYRLRQGAAPELAWSENLSTRGVVTPKVMAFTGPADNPELHLWGYGGFQKARVAWDSPPGKARITTEPWPPGTQSAVNLDGDWVTTNALLDAWVATAPEGRRVLPVPGITARPWEERLGEALFFTELMAPHNTGEGLLSRFTCETCHFEGGTDGRVHFTGRHDVHASTRDLHGLFNNRPHFSRALDKTMAEMVHNEFRVANAGAAPGPWFSLNPRDYPWLENWLPRSHPIDAVEQRRALMRFLMVFSPEENPYAAGRSSFTPRERRGARLFQDRCESCHQARTVTDSAATRVAFQDWEAALFRGRGIVWAVNEYAQTGILPYMHPRGTRVPSLRGVWNKAPLFTNGQAGTLEEAVDTGPEHDGAGEMTPEEKEALTAFLRLL